MTNRTWTKYDYKVGNQIKHSGITEDQERREGEHQRRWPGGRLCPSWAGDNRGSGARVGGNEAQVDNAAGAEVDTSG